MLITVIILLLNYVIRIKVDIFLVLAFILPAYLVISIESLTSYERKAMARIFTRDAFSKWLTQLTQCKPTLHSGGLKNGVLMYDQCVDLTDSVGFAEKLKRKGKSEAIHVKLDLCVVVKKKKISNTDTLSSAKIKSVLTKFVEDGNFASSSIRCCWPNVNRPVGTLDDFTEHVVVCSRRKLWMHNAVFTLCTVLLMSWPYRLLWNAVVSNKELQIVKQITRHSDG